MSETSLNSKNKKLYTLVTFIVLISVINCQQFATKSPSSNCGSRVISLVPKTLNYKNQLNHTKSLRCVAGSIPSFASLDDRCYMLVYPAGQGDFLISINMTIMQKNAKGAVSESTITLHYVLSVKKIRYNELSIQEIQYDISINRVINIISEQSEWLLKPYDSFFAQFTVDDKSKIFQRVFFEFSNLPKGLAGNQLTGVVEGRIEQEPGYYSFNVRVFDMEGNSEQIEVTLLIYDQNDVFIAEKYEDEQTLRRRVKNINQRQEELVDIVNKTKKLIQEKIKLLSVKREDLEAQNNQLRKLEGSQRSLSFAQQWSKGNLQIMKSRLQTQEQLLNKSSSEVATSKRNYQKLMLQGKEKQSEIEKEQIKADQLFEEYLAADAKYTQVRIDLDQCEKQNQAIQSKAQSNLKELDRANFVQNLQDIINHNSQQL